MNNYNGNDHRLDILVLGAMGSDGRPNSVLIRQALDEILREGRSRELLAATNTLAHEVHVPDSLDGQEIVNEVLKWLDIADLVVVNLTPRGGPADKSHSANVYYELGLVHALGLPVILLAQVGTEVPFYFRSYRHIAVADFSVPVLIEALRDRVQKFLNPDDDTDFGDNRITQFYGLPIVDISAAVGLATGYYHNFVGRLLRDRFVSSYPDKVKHLVVVRPQNVLNTYEQDHELLTAALVQAGFKLRTEKLDAPAADNKGPLWIDHVDGIVVDLPRTIYPLKGSPRLLALRERLDRRGNGQVSQQQRDLMLRQHGTQLVRRIQEAIEYHQEAIEYHVRKEGDNYRGQLLSFANIAELPTLLRQLGIKPSPSNSDE